VISVQPSSIPTLALSFLPTEVKSFEPTAVSISDEPTTSPTYYITSTSLPSPLPLCSELSEPLTSFSSIADFHGTSGLSISNRAHKIEVVGVPFDFPWFGANKNEIYVDSNGILMTTLIILVLRIQMLLSSLGLVLRILHVSILPLRTFIQIIMVIFMSANRQNPLLFPTRKLKCTINTKHKQMSTR